MPPKFSNGTICDLDLARSRAFHDEVFAREVIARFRDPAGDVPGLDQQP